MSKPTICSRCASGDHADCSKYYGEWSGLISSSRWRRRRARLVFIGPEWTCVCRHKEEK